MSQVCNPCSEPCYSCMSAVIVAFAPFLSLSEYSDMLYVCPLEAHTLWTFIPNCLFVWCMLFEDDSTFEKHNE
jgi:hypothetical protein